MKPHLIADWDGVLGDTADMSCKIVAELHPEVDREAYLVQHHMGNVFENPVVPFTPQTAAQYYRLYDEQLAIHHVERALPAIIALSDKYTLHVVTSNCEYAIHRVLREAHIEDRFGRILGQEAHASKVEKFLRLFQEENFSADNSVYITDTVGDIKEAGKVSLRTVAVSFGYHPKEVLLEHAPTAFADSWDEAIVHIERLME